MSLKICLGVKVSPEITLKTGDELTAEQIDSRLPPQLADFLRLTNISESSDHALITSDLPIRRGKTTTVPEAPKQRMITRMPDTDIIQLLDPTSSSVLLTLRRR